MRTSAPTEGLLPRATRLAARLVVGMGIGLVLAPTASAKFCVVMDAPERAHVGQTITVRAMTLADGAWVDGRLIQRRPGLALPERVVVAVVDPIGKARTLTLDRSARPDMQRGRLAVERRGTWELRVRAGRYGSCAASQRVEVV